MAKVTQEEFIKRMEEKYGDKYDFSNTIYKGASKRISFKCKGCDTIYSRSANYMISCDAGCRWCDGQGKVSNTKQFIERANEKHNGKYDYSKTCYENAHTKVCITCPIHGDFMISPNSHLNGRGCRKCGIEKNRLPQQGFDVVVAKCKEIFGDKLDFEKAREQYINNHEKVTITCKKHGDFESQFRYLVRGHGCPICKKETLADKFSYSNEEWISKATLIHNGKYTYEKTNYTGRNKKVIVTCPIHGDFEIEAAVHLAGCGCQKCKNQATSERCRLSQDEFIKRLEETYGKGTYIYEEVDYKNMLTPVKVICPKHGEFSRRPCDLLKGGGCSICGMTKGERKITMFLKNNNIDFVPQYKVQIDSIFCKQKNFFLDFYIPSKNVVIEYNGEQHYKPTYFHLVGHKTFEEQEERDWAVRLYCDKNNIKLIEIPYWEYERVEEILKKELKIK